MERGTVKTSTVFISRGNKTEVYRTLDEVPLPLRKKLMKSTGGLNSATILIADRKGAKELLKARQRALAARKTPPDLRARIRNFRLLTFLLLHWIELGLGAVAALALFLLCWKLLI